MFKVYLTVSAYTGDDNIRVFSSPDKAVEMLSIEDDEEYALSDDTSTIVWDDGDAYYIEERIVDLPK